MIYGTIKFFILSVILISTFFRAAKADVKPYRVGVEVGAGFARHEYASDFGVNGGASRLNFSGHQPALGLQGEYTIPLEKEWEGAVHVGARYYTGSLKNSHASILALPLRYDVKQDFRYDVSLKGGKKLHNKIMLYGKGGFLLGHYAVKINDSTFRSNFSQYKLGCTLGIGMDIEIDGPFSLGGVVEYDQYTAVKGHLSNTNAIGASYNIRPNMINVMLTLSYRI